MLPAVLGAIVLFSLLFFAVSRSLDQAHHRVAVSKHQEAAQWLAESGLEVGQARLKDGRLQPGEPLIANFSQGQFEVVLSDGVLLSTGRAGGQQFQLKKEAAR